LQQGIWFLAATGLVFFTIVVTLVFCLVLMPGGPAMGGR